MAEIVEKLETINEQVETIKDKVETLKEQAEMIQDTVNMVSGENVQVVAQVKEIAESKIEEGAKKVAEVVAPVATQIVSELKDENLSKFIKLLTDDANFVNRIEQSIKNILQDGKVDHDDVPELVFIIMDAYNTVAKSQVSMNEIPEFVNCVFNYIADKFNLMPKEERQRMSRLITSSVKLALMAPPINNAVKTSFSCLPCFK
jgi:hypothetical protein